MGCCSEFDSVSCTLYRSPKYIDKIQHLWNFPIFDLDLSRYHKMLAPWNGLPQAPWTDPYRVCNHGPNDPKQQPPRFSYLRIENPNPQRNDRTGGNGFPSISSMHSADCTFYFFPDLPTKLRCLIWWFAVCEPRIVEIHCVDLHCWAVQNNQQSDADPKRCLHTRKFEFSIFVLIPQSHLYSPHVKSLGKSHCPVIPNGICPIPFVRMPSTSTLKWIPFTYPKKSYIRGLLASPFWV